MLFALIRKPEINRSITRYRPFRFLPLTVAPSPVSLSHCLCLPFGSALLAHPHPRLASTSTWRKWRRRGGKAGGASSQGHSTHNCKMRATRGWAAAMAPPRTTTGRPGPPLGASRCSPPRLFWQAAGCQISPSLSDPCKPNTADSLSRRDCARSTHAHSLRIRAFALVVSNKGATRQIERRRSLSSAS